MLELSYLLPVGICIKEARITPYSNLRFSNFEVWDYYHYCWAREMITLHKAYFTIRELYYFDRFINTNRFDFEAWDRKDLAPAPYYLDEMNPETGQMSIHNCPKEIWAKEKVKSLYRHLVKWRIPRTQIITI